MDPVTHILFGAVMGRSGFNRMTGLATATLALSAEMPDLDVSLLLIDPITNFAHHRGFTHTLLAMPLTAAVSLGVIYAAYTWLNRRRGWTPKVAVRWPLLYLFALLGSLSHILLDFTNNYGVRPFMPFSYRWHSWDIVSIIEPLMIGALMLALLGPKFFALIGSEIGEKQKQFAGRDAAISALVFIALMWWARDYNHRQAVALLEREDYNGEQVRRVSAYPYPMNPFHWHGVAETDTFFKMSSVDTQKGEVDAQRNAVVRYKPEETPVTLAAKRSRLGRVYLDWAQYPYVEVQPEVQTMGKPQQGYVVYFWDLRYAYPEGKVRILGGSVDLGPDLKVLDQTMGPREEK